MEVTEALKILDHVSASAMLSRVGHDNVKMAVRTLAQFLQEHKAIIDNSQAPEGADETPTNGAG